jgi:hypothetical protein
VSSGGQFTTVRSGEGAGGLTWKPFGLRDFGEVRCKNKRRVEARREVPEEIYTVDLGRSLTIGSSQVKKGKHSGEGRSPEAPKSGVNPDHPSRGTRVSRWACLGFRCSGELVCVEARTPEVRSSEARRAEVVSHDDVTWR